MQKNPLVSAVASFIIPGLGQIINGDITKGVGMVAVLVLLNLFIYFSSTIRWDILWVWHIPPMPHMMHTPTAKTL